MNLGDVTHISVPKMTLISHTSEGWYVSTRTVILDINDQGATQNAAILRTARKLFDGTVFPR